MTSKEIKYFKGTHRIIPPSETIANNEDTAKKFEAMGWNVIIVKNGNDYNACNKAIASAKNSNKPSIIIFKTTIGFGTKHEGLSKIHAYPLPSDELEEYLQYLGIMMSRSWN